jgi:hypothetical protein
MLIRLDQALPAKYRVIMDRLNGIVEHTRVCSDLDPFQGEAD